MRREATTDKSRVNEVRSVWIKDEVKQGVLGNVQKSQLQLMGRGGGTNWTVEADEEGI